MEVNGISCRRPHAPKNFKKFVIDRKRTERTVQFIQDLSCKITRTEIVHDVPTHFEICNFMTQCYKKMQDCAHKVVIGCYKPSKDAKTTIPKISLFSPDGSLLKNFELNTALEIVKRKDEKIKAIIREVRPKFCEQIESVIDEALQLDKKTVKNSIPV